jgi:hypothetical protein
LFFSTKSAYHSGTPAFFKSLPASFFSGCSKQTTIQVDGVMVRARRFPYSRDLRVRVVLAILEKLGN